MYVATASPARDESASYVAWGHSTVVNPWYSKGQEGEFSPKSKMYTFPLNCRADKTGRWATCQAREFTDLIVCSFREELFFLVNYFVSDRD